MLRMRKAKVKTIEQLVFSAVKVEASEVVSDKARALVIEMPLLPKWEAWRVEVLNRPVSGKERSA
jgi:glyoxylate utilization-related uncharacterized protein